MRINAKKPQLQWTSFFFPPVFGRCIFSNIVRFQLINVCNLLILSCGDFVLVNVAKDLSICNTNVATHHRCRLSFSREFGELPSRYFKSALVVAYLGLLIRKTFLLRRGFRMTFINWHVPFSFKKYLLLWQIWMHFICCIICLKW